MSSNDDDQGGAGRREVAYRVFAAEFEDADFSYSESDEERAPNYVVTPTGARVNRLFLVGVLTEVEEAGEDILRARVVDPTGAFVVYAGQYQPDAQAFFDRAEPPAFVAVTGKARTFEPEDSDVTYTSVRPENVNEVTAETRDRWSVQAARQTLDRVATMARALDREERGDELRRLLEGRGVDIGLAAGIPLAIDHYGTTGAYLDAVRDLAVQVAEVVAGERDEVEAFSTSPAASGPADLAELAALDVPAGAGGDGAVDAGTVASSGATGVTGPSETSASAETSTDASSESTAESAESAGEPTTDSAESAPSAESTESADSGTSTGAAAETTESTEAAETDEAVDVTSAAAEPVESAAAEPVESAGTAGATEETEPAESGSTAGGSEEIGDFESGEFELDEEEREEIEAEYGTDFQSGTEVDDPGEADIDTPEPDTDPAEPEASAAAETETASREAGEGVDDVGAEAAETVAAETEETAETEAEETAETEAEETAETEVADAEDVDIGEAVMEAMRDNDDGNGASEDAIVAAVTDRLDVDDEEVRDALQEALMGGQCYEPEDGVYKPI